MKNTYIACLIFFIASYSNGQVNQQWASRYDPYHATDYANVVRADDSGNVYVFGSSAISGLHTQMCLVKYDSSGNILWVKSYYQHNGNGVLMELDNNGNVYVVGKIDSDITNYYRMCAIKYRPNGDTVWIRTNDSMETPYFMNIDKSGNIYVSGMSHLDQNYLYKTSMTKIDSNGIQKWNKSLLLHGYVRDYPIAQRIDKNQNIYFCITSFRNTSGTTPPENSIVRCNSNGDTLWSKSYYDTSWALFDFYIDAASNIIVSGGKYSTPGNINYAAYIDKLDSTGSILFHKNYNGYAGNVLADSMGNIFICGQFYGGDIPKSYIAKLTGTGDTVWSRIFDGVSSSTHMTSIALDYESGIYWAGSTGDGMLENYLTFKYNSDGDFQWFKTYDGYNRPNAIHSICVDKRKNVYVTGASYDNASMDPQRDFLTIKYSQIEPFIDVEVKVLFEGLYFNLLNKMLRIDTVHAFLRSTFAPFAIMDSALCVIDSNNFSGSLTFLNAPTGYYYITIDHKGTLETWSRSGGEYLIRGFSAYSYNFTDSINKAYGSNMKLKGAKYCVFSGDINNDKLINLFDLTSIFNDAAVFSGGRYIQTDLNGDNAVDLADLTLCYNNSITFIRTIRP